MVCPYPALGLQLSLIHIFLGKTAVLEFRDADGNVGITGKDIKEAKSNYGPIEQNGPSQYYVSLKLNTCLLYTSSG